MFFNLRKTYYLILFVLTCLSVSGCSEFVNGKKEEPKVIEVSNAHLSCLKKLPLQLKQFVVGEAQQEDFGNGIDCLSTALRYFHKKTYGSVEGSYTAEEIRNFFNKYFLKENNLTSEFTTELMKIKKVLVGGSESTLTKAELLGLVDTLHLVKDDLVDLAPYVKIVTFSRQKKGLQWEELNFAVNQLQKSLHSLLQKTEIVSSNYRFDDAKNAFERFIKFTKAEQGNSYVAYKNWLPAVESVKKLLLGSNAHFADLYHWQENLDSFIEFYDLALKRYYFFNNIEIQTELKLDRFKQFFDQGIKLLLDCHQMKTAGLISVDSIDNLIDQVLSRTKSSITAKSLKKAYRFVLLKILSDTKLNQPKMILGLEKKHLMVLQQEFNVWWLLQKFINQLPFDNFNGGFNSYELLEEYKKFDARFIIEHILTEDPLEQSFLQSSWKDLESQIKQNLPTAFNEQGQIIISKNLTAMKRNWSSLTQANAMKSLSRILMTGYGENQNRSGSSMITKASLSDWYDDFRDLGLDLKAFDPRTVNSGARSFLEANLFTYHGNGDEFMDQTETFEFVSFLFSAGLSSAEKIRLDMILNKCSILEKDIFGNPFIKENCFKKILFQNFAIYFGNLPGLAKYTKSLTQSQWDLFYFYLLQAAKVDDQKNGYIETANIRTMVMILHYIESTMIVFDTNGDDLLSIAEIYSATPRYMSFVKSVTDVKNETLLREGFAYLLYNGTKPGALDLLKFQWQKLKGLPDIQRLELLRLFSALKDQLNNSKN